MRGFRRKSAHTVLPPSPVDPGRGVAILTDVWTRKRLPVARKLFAAHKTLVASSDVLALENERLLDANTSLVVACTLLAEGCKQLDELNTGHGRELEAESAEKWRSAQEQLYRLREKKRRVMANRTGNGKHARRSQSELARTPSRPSSRRARFHVRAHCDLQGAGPAALASRKGLAWRCSGRLRLRKCRQGMWGWNVLAPKYVLAKNVVAKLRVGQKRFGRKNFRLQPAGANHAPLSANTFWANTYFGQHAFWPRCILANTFAVGMWLLRRRRAL